MQNNGKKPTKGLSKGERLNWTPVSKLIPVKLDKALLEGERIEYAEIKKHNQNGKLFVL